MFVDHYYRTDLKELITTRMSSVLDKLRNEHIPYVMNLILNLNKPQSLLKKEMRIWVLSFSCMTLMCEIICFNIA